MSKFEIDESTMRMISNEFNSTIIRKYVPGKGDEKGSRVKNTNNLKKSYRPKVVSTGGNMAGAFVITAGNNTVKYAQLRNNINKRNPDKTKGVERTFKNDFETILKKFQSNIDKSTEKYVVDIWKKGG
jgi:hypothetical protein